MADRIKGITVEIGGDTTGLSKALSGINKDIKNTQTQLKDVEKLLKLDPSNTELLSQKQKLLKEAIGETKDKLQQLRSVQDQMEAGLKNGSVTQEQYDAWQREIVATEQELKKLEEQCRNTDTSISSTLKEAGSKVSAVGDKMASVGDSLSKNVTAPIAAIGAVSIAAWNEVDAGLDTIIKKTGATGDALADMKNVLESVSTTIPVSFENAGAAIGEVNTRFHATGAELEDLSILFLKFAEINDTDVSGAVDDVSYIMQQFGLSTADTAGLLGKLTKVSQDTGVSTDELTSALLKSGSTLRAMGLDAGKSISLLAKFSEAGIDSEDALKAMSKAAQNYSKDGTDVADGLAALVEGVRNGTIAFDELADVVGSKNALAFQDMATSGRLSLDDLESDLRGYAGTVSQTFDETQDSLDSFTTTLNQLKLLGADLVETLGPIIADVLKSVTSLVKDLKEKWDSLSPATQELIVKAGLLAAAVGPVLSVGGRLISGCGSLITTLGNVGTKVSGLIKQASGAETTIGGIGKLLSTDVGTCMSSVQGSLATAGAAVTVFMAAFSITDWLLELTGAKEDLEQFGSDIYDYFHKEQNASVDLTNSAMAAFEAYAMRGEGTYEEVMRQLTAAQEAALEANTDITRQDAESLQKFIDLMENGVAEARANEALARQQANETLLAENEMTVATMQAAMDAAQRYIEDGSGDLETIMENLNAAYEYYAAQGDIVSQKMADQIQTMIDTLTESSETAAEVMSFTAENAAENMNTLLEQTGTYLATSEGSAEQILADLQAAYAFYAAQTDDASQTTAASIEEMMRAVSDASGIAIDDTSTMSEETVASLAEISAAMNSLGITDIGAFVSAISEGMSSIETDVDASFRGMVETISTKMDEAVKAVETAVTDIENRFANANLSFSRHIDLPHFSMSGSFNAQSGSVPSVGVSWYRKAMEHGMILDSPTIFGYSNGRFLGGGEAGSEAVVGTNSLLGMIRDAVADSSENGTLISMLAEYLPYLPQMANMQMVTDTGALVGQLAPRIDEQLGVIAMRQRRQ